MLMHSCYCIFISVTGGFVQMLKDFKNLLKMSLKILFIKRKRKIPSISSPSSHSACMTFFSRGPAPAPAQLPSPPLLQQPPPLRPLGPAGPAPPARNAPAHLARNCRRAFLSPSAADSLAPAVRAFPHLRTSRACAQP